MRFRALNENLLGNHRHKVEAPLNQAREDPKTVLGYSRVNRGDISANASSTIFRSGLRDDFRHSLLRRDVAKHPTLLFVVASHIHRTPTPPTSLFQRTKIGFPRSLLRPVLGQ